VLVPPNRADGKSTLPGLKRDRSDCRFRLAWPQGTGSQEFLDAYTPLCDTHEDWLGFIAVCELRFDPPVVRGGYRASAGGIFESYGVDLTSQMDTLMADTSCMAAFSSKLVCATT
jgi:hypothetical protein